MSVVSDSVKPLTRLAEGFIERENARGRGITAPHICDLIAKDRMIQPTIVKITRDFGAPGAAIAAAFHSQLIHIVHGVLGRVDREAGVDTYLGTTVAGIKGCKVYYHFSVISVPQLLRIGDQRKIEGYAEVARGEAIIHLAHRLAGENVNTWAELKARQLAACAV
jgi:hypothetical protein